MLPNHRYFWLYGIKYVHCGDLLLYCVISEVCLITLSLYTGSKETNTQNNSGNGIKISKPSTSPSPTKEAKKQQNKNEEKQPIEEKLEKLSLGDSKEETPTTQSPKSSSKSTRLHEKPTVIELQNDSHDTDTSKDVELTTADVEEEQRTREGQDEEGETGNQEELKAKVEATEEKLIESLERVQQESQETQEKIKKLTSYMKALDTTPSEISPTDEGASPQPESQGNGATGGTSAMVGDMDLVAQAALLAGIKERTTTTFANTEEHTDEIMEPVQVSETDPNNIVIVGEIVGPQIESPLEEDTHTAASEATSVDPKLPCGESADLIGQTEPPIDGKLNATPAVPETEPSQQDSAVEVESFKEGRDGQSIEASKAAKEMVEPPAPSFHSPSKKPKRQLAASFMNTTKE